jgi:hypothetical protein
MAVAPDSPGVDIEEFASGVCTPPGVATSIVEKFLEVSVDPHSLPRDLEQGLVFVRVEQVGIPADRRFATKPQLSQQMLQRALAAGRPAKWVTGDSVYGDDRRLRLWLEAQPQAYVLAVSGQACVCLGGRQRQVKTIVAALPEEGWTRLRLEPPWSLPRRRPLASSLNVDGERQTGTVCRGHDLRGDQPMTI